VPQAASAAGGGDRRGTGGGWKTEGAGRGQGDSEVERVVREGGEEFGGGRGSGSEEGGKMVRVSWDFQMYDVYEGQGGWVLKQCVLPPDPVVMCVAVCCSMLQCVAV